MTSAPEGLVVRPVSAEEFADWVHVTEVPFFDEITDERIARFRLVSELDRSLAAFVGGRMVGASLLFRMSIPVPGAVLPMGGLTAVGVLPTHRRRGVLSALLQRHFQDLREWSEPLSGLYAAEAPIYGRFGYGSAAPQMYWTIDKADTALLPDVSVDTGVELVTHDEARATFPAIHDAVRAGRPGMPDRSAAMWEHWLAHDPPDGRDGMSARYLARLGDRGYAVYRATTGDWPKGLPRGTMEIYEHMAVDTAAAAGLWRYLFDHDLISTFKVSNRPTDDILPLLLTNPRGLAGWESDGMWLRLIDVPAALSARTYAVSDGLTIGVIDRRLPDNSRSWRVEGGPDGAACTRTAHEPDLLVDVGDLGGAYLGNVKFSRLVRAKRAEEGTPGAAVRADLMFTTDPAPWCPQVF